MNSNKLVDVLENNKSNVITKIYKYIENNNLFDINKNYTKNISELRKLTLLRAKNLLDSTILTKDSIMDDPRVFFTLFDVCHLVDVSMAIKFGVHVGLAGNAIYKLGTQKHYDKYFDDMVTMKRSCCFALTEFNHGSNVRGIETTATYIQPSHSFIINTPNDGAQKIWIGNAANDGNTAVVFAKLIINNKDYGIHAFIVQIRDLDTHKILDGITIKDCGIKAGLNGVDNGRIWFDNVEIPYDNLLDSYCYINRETSEYVSQFKTNDKRLEHMLSLLSGGRIGLSSGALYVSRLSLSLAIEYSFMRRQFNEKPNDLEFRLIDFHMHQLRLIPLIAKTFAFTFSINILKNMYYESYKNNNNELTKEIHTISCGIKSLTTWHTLETIQTCRECCGGNGFAQESRFGMLRDDMDIFATFEGDNNVILQQVAKGLLEKLKNKKYQTNTFFKINELKEEFKGNLDELNILNLLEYGYMSTLLAVGFKMNKEHKKFKKEGKDRFFPIWNENIKQLMFLSKTYIKWWVMKCFNDFINKQFGNKNENQVLKTQLKALYKITGLTFLNEDIGFYLANGLHKKNYAKINDKIGNLCQTLKPDLHEIMSYLRVPKWATNNHIANNNIYNDGYLKSKL